MGGNIPISERWKSPLTSKGRNDVEQKFCQSRLLNIDHSCYCRRAKDGSGGPQHLGEGGDLQVDERTTIAGQRATDGARTTSAQPVLSLNHAPDGDSPDRVLSFLSLFER
ncbi:MAG: hypothetical protein ABI237_03150 [Ginsengibacter sp.]